MRMYENTNRKGLGGCELHRIGSDEKTFKLGFEIFKGLRIDKG